MNFVSVGIVSGLCIMSVWLYKTDQSHGSILYEQEKHGQA